MECDTGDDLGLGRQGWVRAVFEVVVGLRRVRDAPGAQADSVAREPTPEELAVALDEVRRILRRARRLLTAAEFEAFIGFYESGGTVHGAAAELSELTGTSAASVRTQIRRARLKLRAAATREGWRHA